MHNKLLLLALMCVFVGTVFALNPQKRIPMPNPWPPFGLPKNATEIIRGYGYPCEDHNTTTPDGFVLSIQHIPHGVNQTASTKPKPVVFLQHGLQDCSVGWTLNLPNESLSYILADAGYDVWLGNNRATLYSMENLYYNISQPEYWAWSFDEMAKYDLPSQIDYVLNVTGAKTLTYIGHSQGTIQAFAGFLNPEVAAKVNLYVALAPIAYLGNIKSVMLKDLADMDADKLLELLGMHEFWLGPFPNITEVFLPAFCYEEPDFCMNIVSLWCGKSDNLNDTRTAYYLMYEPSPTSVQNIAHLAQEVRSGKFEMYNYGIDNMKYYGQKDPPIYDMTKFPPNLPTALFYGGQDDLADTTDVEALMNQLPTPPYAHYEPTYAHLDPLLGMDAAIKIYPRVLELMGMYSKYP